MSATGRIVGVGKLLKGWAPGQVVVQLTDRCNARCPQCGMSSARRFARSSLAPETVRRIVDHAAASGMGAVSFTGGEPFLPGTGVLGLVRHARAAGIDFVRSGTNGYMFAGTGRAGWRRKVEKLAVEIAASGLRNFWISLDSACPEVHERIRGLSGVVGGIERAIPVLHEAGVHPSVNIGINRLTGGSWLPELSGLPGGREERRERFAALAETAIRRVFARAAELGFTLANVCYPMGGREERGAVYMAASADPMVGFSREEKAIMFAALGRVVREFRPRIRVFTPLASIDLLVAYYAGGADRRSACRGGAEFFFVDAREGQTYPCGYRSSEKLGKFWDLDLSRHPLPAGCKACDWECFRDASHLHGTIMRSLARPLTSAIDWLTAGSGGRAAWIDDLRYAIACDLFDGRIAPDPDRMATFGATEIPPPDRQHADRGMIESSPAA